MPKAFSEKEKQAIRTSLMDVGIKRFATQGIRAVRIDDICHDAGIAKGSFYAFFPSKEDLFMAIADTRDIKHKTEMRTFLLEAEGDAKHIINGFFDFMMQRIESDPIFKIVKDTGEITHLIRKVSPDLLAEHTRRDHEFMAEVSGIFQTRHNLKFADAQTLEGLMTVMLSLSMQSEFIKAAGNYPAMIELMRDLFLTRLMKGSFDDQS